MQGGATLLETGCELRRTREVMDLHDSGHSLALKMSPLASLPAKHYL